MNKQQKEQYQKELEMLKKYMDKYYPGCLDDIKIQKKLKKAARMIVLKNTFWYKIKRFFINRSYYG